MSADEETAARDLMWEAQKSAEEALSLAMLRLGGEAPAQVYDEKGYTIWVESVAKSIWEPVASHLSQELKAAREERDELERERDQWKKVAFDNGADWGRMVDRVIAAEANNDGPWLADELEKAAAIDRAERAESLFAQAEERANRYQMQYEEECEVHGDHIGALEKCQAEIETLRALLAQRDEALERDRILWNEGREEIDEIVVHGCTVHVEQMSDRHWWMAVYKGEGARRFVLDFSVLPGRRKAMTCTGYDDCVEGGPWVWGEDSEHEWPVKS